MSTPHHPTTRWTGKVFVLALLASCGGGGGDPPAALSGSPGAAPAPAPDPATNEPPATSPGSAATATCGLNNFATSALARINQLRSSGTTCGARGVFAPTTALTWNALLTQAGAGHSQDMSTLNFFSHTSLDGRTLTDRVNATGYSWNALGENIAAGYATVDSVMDGWIASDGHCANLMNPSFTEFGMACIPGAAASNYNTYWTMDLGRPR